ncbi:hypothetical protein G9C98_005516 [Cotesia typhae]|uniref:AAA+ ATPase domain-containing protein n=1 Tax=Cotesia typhae TaxID=2053667 RepID=A0A8J5UYD8_9HYME|nr:hypothetical protein G9C98_005516 [Cotesia typhae]
MSKSRKSLSTLWVTCDKCQSAMSQKDTCFHESTCPPSDVKWTHNYIRNNILYSSVDTYCSKELPKNITERDSHEMVFMSQSALELCQIAIGDRVILSFQDVEIVKTAWPTSDKSLTSVCLTKNTMDVNKVSGPVKVRKLKNQPLSAEEITIKYVGRQEPPKITPELQILFKNYNERKIFCIGNRINIPFYGKNLPFKIVNITQGKDNNSSLNTSSKDDLADGLKNMSITERELKFFLSLFTTKWKVIKDEINTAVNKKSKITANDIGGYDKLLNELRDIVDVVLGKCKQILKGFRISKSILLYGLNGVGKTTIANVLFSSYDVKTFSFKASEISTKYLNNENKKISDLFSEAKAEAPSVIFIDDIDTLFTKKGLSDSEKRFLAMLIQEIDDLQESDANTLLLMTTSKLDSIDSSLRRSGRLDREIEIPTPTPNMRCAILKKLISKMPNTFSDDDFNEIAYVTHGFVAADLNVLCSQAGMRAIKRHQDNKLNPYVYVSALDFMGALRTVKPTAMKEISVEVPNVKWSDIGGQKSLKLKLCQAVEWPLKNPDVFIRLGITPPKGLLMYGPPGCSKTMGPELFSKWVGESERAVREVFRKANEVAPSIVFIDEIDAIGGERATGGAANASNNVQERVLAQLLTELDGVTALGNVTLVAATNRPDRIDKALLRPGRLDRLVYVPLPDADTRGEIFKIKFLKMPVDEISVKIQDLVDLTDGYSGAEIQAVCHEAAMSALQNDINSEVLLSKHFADALKIVKPRTSAKLISLYENFCNNTNNK